MDGPKFICQVCGKGYSTHSNLARHEKSHGTIKHACRLCTYRTDRVDALQRHYRLYHGRPMSSTSRKRPHGTAGGNYQELDSHIPGPSNAAHVPATSARPEMQQPSRTLLPSVKAKQSIPLRRQLPLPIKLTHVAATEETQQESPNQRSGVFQVPSLATAFEEEKLDEEEDDSDLDQLLTQNRRWIQDYRSVSHRAQDRYNFELTSGNPKQLEQFLRLILSEQHHPFKVNAALGYVLTNTVSGQHSFYYASRNTRLLESPFLIHNLSDISTFMQQIESTDLLEHARQQRPNTKFTVRMITNVLFYVNKIKEFNIGYAPELPDYIRYKQSIITLNKGQDGQVYRDNFCLFRCYEYHRNPRPYPSQTVVGNLAAFYCGARKLHLQSFSGVPLKDLHAFEDLFKVNLEIYELIQERDDNSGTLCVKAMHRRVSRQKYEDTINLNLHKNHFSYITDLQSYTDCWMCRKCRKLFKKRGHLNQHEPSCNVTTKLLYPGGGYGLPKHLFEQLQEHGIEIDDELFYYPYRMAFDYEALSVPIVDDRQRKEQFLGRQVPASVSVCSNVPNFTTPKCFVSEGDPHVLVAEMYQYMVEVSFAAYDLLCQKYEKIINELDYYVQERAYLIEQADELSEVGDKEQAEEYRKDAYRLYVYERLSKQLDEWLSRVPTLGFNSGKYDFNLIRAYLFPYFLDNGITVDKIIKKNNDYLSVTTSHVVFLDIKNYVAAGTSYAGWLKANGITQGKGFFPYGWFTCLSRLNQTFLPPVEEFWSELRQEGISAEDYAYLQKVWRTNDFKTMRDLLVWYNNLDVTPFLLAAEKMFKLWKGLNIDCFKSNIISLPGLALSYLISEMQPHTTLPLFDDKTADIHQTVRNNITGGLSIVNHRYHEKNVTKLPNGKSCEWIYSHDANSLYLWALGEPTGTGLFATWRPKPGSGEPESFTWLPPTERDRNDDKLNYEKWNKMANGNLSTTFYRQQAYPYARTETDWLEWTSYISRRTIEHRFNGRPKTVFVSPDVQYRVDGYHPGSQTIYQFHGCYWHGHGCKLDGNKNLADRQLRYERTTQVTKTLQELKYNVVEMWECEWREERKQNPQIYLFLEEHLNLKSKHTQQDGFGLIAGIKDGNLFGLLECDIEVPWWNDELISYFSEFPPICKNVEISRDQIGPHMRIYAEERGYMKRPTKCLVNSFWGQKILLTTPMVKWLLEHGLVLTRIYQLIEMKPKACFASIRDDIADHRRRADVNPDYKPMGEAWKTIGNSCYGKTMTRKDRQKDTVLATDGEASKLINSKAFNKMEEVGDTAYEICSDKTRIKLDLPLTVAFFVYNYAKMKMLDFVYGFLKKYLRSGSYQIVCSDTDSIIAAYESKNLDDLVKNELREEYLAVGKKRYLATDDYTKRTPGLMKEEWSGVGILALCSKTYFTWNETDKKISSKGLSKKTNDFTKEDYLKVLTTKLKGTGTNYGFRVRGDELLQYKQDREGLAYLYTKRQVQSDGVSTEPLFL